MITLLVPVDFSENSLDAARYAIGLLPQLGTGNIVLYHSMNFEGKPEASVLKELEEVKEELNRANKAEITCVVNNDTLPEGIAGLVKQHQVSLIVMGITGRNKVGQKLIGSNAFQVSQNADVPVLIIPGKAVPARIKSIAVALPIIAGLKEHTPHEEIKLLVKTFDATLMVVNVLKNKDKTPKPIVYAGLADIFDMFDELSPSYHFLTAQNAANSVADFAKDNHAQLLISIAGKYGFLQGMFKSSVTKKLAYNSTVPLLIYRSGIK